MKSSLKISLSMTGTQNCNSGGKINICISKLSLESAGNQMISTNCNYVLKHTCVIKSNTRCTFKYAYVNIKFPFTWLFFLLHRRRSSMKRWHRSLGTWTSIWRSHHRTSIWHGMGMRGSLVT